MPPRKKTVTSTTSATQVTPQTTKIETALLKIRDICRDHGLQIWDKQSLSDQIYQDLLFFYHCPRLQREGLLQLNLADIGNGQLPEFTLAAIVALKDDKLMSSAVKDLWRELQESAVKPLFADRQFKMFAIEKNEKKAPKYYVLLRTLLTYMASITLDSYDSNAGYTYFKKDLNKGTAKTFGQFYTPPTVLKSVVDLVDPCVGESVLDPSSGSCSFLQESASHIMRAGASREKAFATLYGIEVEPNIYAEGIMNIFINFGFLPDMKKNIREEDAFLELLRSETRYDKIVANPPFGADAKSFQDFYTVAVMEPPKKAGGRMKKVVQQNPEVKTTIPFTQTKESAILFFQLIIQSLKVGGKAGVVMSATILNDGHKEMIEWFLKCCSLEKVVINPAGTFKDQGTGIETFSFIFTKGKPTTTVEIVMLGAENDAVRTLTLDQIKEAGWKLQLKEEEKKVENEAFSYDEIKNLFEFEPGTVAASSAIPGEYPFMTLDDTATHSSFGYDNENLFISKIPSGTGSTFTPKFRYSNGKVHASSLMLRLIPKSERVSLKFFYYFWKLKPIEVLRSFYKGAANKSLDQDLFRSFRFPIPPFPIQQEIVTALDLFYNTATTAKAAAASVKSQMAAVMRSVGARGFERKKLSEACDISKGRRNLNGKDTGYPYQDVAHISRLVENYILDGPAVLTPRAMSVGRFVYTDEKCHPSDDMFILKSKDGLLPRYLFHYCNLLLVGDIRQSIHGVKPTIDYSAFDINHIIVPPLPIQHEVLAILNEMEAELAMLEQMAAKAEQRAKFILNGYLTPAPAI